MAIRLQEIWRGDARMRAFTWNPSEDTSLVSVTSMPSKTGNDKTRARRFDYTRTHNLLKWWMHQIKRANHLSQALVLWLIEQVCSLTKECQVYQVVPNTSISRQFVSILLTILFWNGDRTGDFVWLLCLFLCQFTISLNSMLSMSFHVVGPRHCLCVRIFPPCPSRVSWFEPFSVFLNNVLVRFTITLSASPIYEIKKWSWFVKIHNFHQFLPHIPIRTVIVLDTSSAACPSQSCNLAMTSITFAAVICHELFFSKDCAGSGVVLYNVTSENDSSFVLLEFGFQLLIFRWQMSINEAKWTFFSSLCTSRITSFFCSSFYPKSKAGVASSFFYSLSTAAFASGIFIACGIGINLCTKLSCTIELYPLPAIWSSWCSGRDDYKSCLVDSWASTIQACFVFEILPELAVSAPVSDELAWLLVPFLQGIGTSIGTSNFLLALYDGIFIITIVRIDKVNSSQSPSIIEFGLLVCPLLLFSFLSGFSNPRPDFRSGCCLNFFDSRPGPRISLRWFLFQ